MTEDNENKKILVHTCCVACLSYVSKILIDDGFVPVVFFYNPEAHGRSEYNKRLKDVERYCEKNELELIVPEYNVQDFFSPIMPYTDKDSIKYISDKKRWKNKRCQLCFSILLSKTAHEAKQRGIKHFTTTFLTSPYKDHDEIWNQGLELEREMGLGFYYKDFRKGYWSGRNYARSHKMCIPSYCGCVYSLEEGILE